ncbi:hypothetical protein [Bacillus dakarensis]|uniref:hypothetical protein n=1 Tax=Robertmurraya dakarensis TaxID=1926278 RepID=UPI0012B6A558|nr:hypothetical protein [Bacillus dakarensis]
MKRYIMASFAYLTTGTGIYHTFFSGSKFYEFLILTIGLAGVLYDFFYKKIHTG